MKRTKFTYSQIMDGLNRVDVGLVVSDVCRELGISSATFYKWQAKQGGIESSMMARMKEPEAENAHLKMMCIEEKLKAETLNEAITKK
jgi:putative transposase